MSWPVTLVEQDRGGRTISLRPIRVRDGRAWREVRRRNHDWLQPWEATLPAASSVPGEIPATFGSMVRRMRHEAHAGRMLPWVIAVDGRLAGQVTVGGISYGSLRSAYIGYWIDQAVAGQGIVPTCVAMAVDHCFEALMLHRIEINIRPENQASRRVVDKLGIAEEGYRRAYLHIDGQWRDHLSYVVLADEVPGGLLTRWRAGRS